ncbi:bifunctional 4-hydroxy-2-oxoglutarate aldolase/2-dehydro-3-deoxy-phosphogluconate aldolase [Halopseudomonas nanhaiensis]|uniref:bifunctional 4-hydroxy-2-oxoglutarate aldolase/2-dehydro-3-deoxy-phosphogluconate aldolase n=1 Tax=Halopseudomonas nanhaiensis TaxID=2830842 RepID=UPI001CBCE152|nr:bifunctional 4-hydroxy-2-oxoglutarate aldolase/2-dehydro-3-deoxy-phosphogluconate aldolase [Halopseudomonas nanhaiensis]UAW99316.1 bifunctional 4-hydroxy-2-oxoglutarate aldolase/2-dehydro-3-deoxy-phosphogluconate aldolase [Halopseudomonas nanhaiensis]
MSLADNIETLDRIFASAPVLPVISLRRAEDALALADALEAGGVTTLEITLRTSHALGAIAQLRRERPHLCVGAGTILDGRQYQLALDAGAQFVVTPGCTEELLTLGLDSPVPLLPGVATASEILQGYRFGYRRFKLYPAEVCGGIAALNSFAGPFAGIRFCPTGGVARNKVPAYLALENVMGVGGTWMAPTDLIAQQDWAGITRVCRESMAEAVAARSA